MTVAPTRSAVVVFVAEAEPAVGGLRAALDRSAGWGVGAHVTVTFPFVPPRSIDADVVRRLARAVAGVSASRCGSSGRPGSGEQALYLAPDPAEPFRDLNARVLSEFPGHPPYQGEFTELIPHLTVGHLGTPERLRSAEREVQQSMPVTARTDRAHLIVGALQPGSWRTFTELPLGR